VHIGVMNPGRDIYHSFLPCGASGVGTLTEAFLIGDTVPKTFATRNQRLVRDPVIHRLLYLATENCLGKKGAVSEVVWLVADAIFSVDDLMWCKGIWIDKEDGRQLIILDSQYLFSPEVITHESLHSITRYGDPLPESVRKCQYGWGGGP
jgi:hypothetical protein